MWRRLSGDSWLIREKLLGAGIMALECYRLLGNID
jgi:hypothetical protein